MMRTREKEPRRVPQIVDSGHPHVTQAASPASSDSAEFSPVAATLCSTKLLLYSKCARRVTGTSSSSDNRGVGLVAV